VRPSASLLLHLGTAMEEHPSPPPSLVAVVEEGGVLGPKHLAWVAANLRVAGLGEKLLACSMELPRRVVAARSEELEERCRRLRMEQEGREYRRMTGNVSREGRCKEEEPIKKQLKEVNGFLLLIMQFVVSVVCAFMAGYMGPYLLYGRQDTAGRLLLGIVLAFVVGCADMYFVIRQLLEEDGIKLKKIE